MRRRWALAPTSVSGVTSSGAGAAVRSTSTADDEELVHLLDASYSGTIDFDPDADHQEELRVWRTHDGADDGASFVALLDDRIVAAALIGRELGSAFLYELVTAPECRRRRLAETVLRASLTTLAGRSEDMVAAWVTDGNVASEALLARNGFVPVTPPLRREQALGLYRAAQAVDVIDASPTAAIAVSCGSTGGTLWVVEEDAPPIEADIRGTAVQVEFVDAEGERVELVANTAAPLRRASWLLAHRTRRR